MRERIRAVLGSTAAPSWLGTFHGLGARQLRASPRWPGCAPASTSSTPATARASSSGCCWATATDDDEQADRPRPAEELCDRISRFKDDLITPDRCPSTSKA